MQQKQVLAPRMIQSMEILQLPILALQERIEQEIEENPVLDLQEDDPDLPAGELPRAEVQDSPDAPTEEERELVINETTKNEDDFERLMKMDEEWPDHFEEHSRPSRGETEEAGERKLDAMANMIARPQSLAGLSPRPVGLVRDRAGLAGDVRADHLQPRYQRLSARPPGRPLGAGRARRKISPWPSGPWPWCRGSTRPAWPPAICKNACCCNSLPGMPLFEQLQTLITSHLEDIEHNRLPVISRRTGFSIELIQQALTELRKLNPKPGADYNNVPVPPVTPDVFVELGEDGKYQVRLEDGRTPSLFISPYYRKLFAAGQVNDETREYIKRKINSAQWLIDSIQQRRSTLTRVAQAIVDHQTEFLSKGPEAIEPLKMQQIADKVGRPRDHGQPGGGRQVDPDAARASSP